MSGTATSPTWTPERFWEYADGLLGTFVRDQMRDVLAKQGLVIAPAGSGVLTREVSPEMLEAGAQALANDVWHPPQPLASLSNLDANRFRRNALLVLKAALSVVAEAAEGPWQPIETAPDDKSGKYPIQVCGGGFRGTSVAHWSGEVQDATHWAPMLSPPLSSAQSKCEGGK